MFGLSPLDSIIIVVYFTALLYLGFRAMKHIRTQEDYFLGGRRFGKLLLIFSAFGQATSADTAVGTTTTTFRNGASGIWSALLMIWATPVYWLTSPWYRRLRVLTMGDFFEDRYGSRRMAGVYAFISALFMMALIAVGMKAVSSTVMGIAQKQQSQLSSVELHEYHQATDLTRLRELKALGRLDGAGEARLSELELIKPRKEFPAIDEVTLIGIICAVVFIYAFAGGLEAAVYTDMLQGIFIIILSVILIPFGLHKVNALFGGEGMLGALRAIHQRLPESHFDIFGSADTADFTWYYIAAVSLMVTINVAVQANQMAAIGSAKDELTSRIGFTTGTFLKRICTVLWGLFGLVAVALYSATIDNPDYVWGHATRDLLGPVGIGLVGLMVACLLAALMSTADTLMITAAGILTRNLYVPLVPGREESHYVNVGRITGAVVLIGGGLLAMYFDTILQLLKFIWEFNAILAAAFWCGIKWRRANRIGAWTSMGVTALLFAVVPILLPVFTPSLRTHPYLSKMTSPTPITRTYLAREMDIGKRGREIAYWDSLSAAGTAVGPRPSPIAYGEQLTATLLPPPKSVFWSKGLKVRKGAASGDGLLYVELILIDRFIDLGSTTYALNETIRTLLRVIVPFGVLILVSLLTRSDAAAGLDRFFVKMRTTVHADRRKDEEELARSYADPNRFKERLLFPKSGWEFFKWDRTDVIGFAAASLFVVALIGILQLMLRIGA